MPLRTIELHKVEHENFWSAACNSPHLLQEDFEDKDEHADLA
jgi:hypothetical protein